MRLNLTQNLKLSQEMRLTPMMIQSMEILQLQILQLQARINQELEENPVLEIADEPEHPEAPVEAEVSETREIEGTEKEGYTQLDTFEKGMSEDEPRIKPGKPDIEGMEAKHEAMQNTAAPSITLQDHVYNQLRLMKLNEREMEIAEHIVFNINDDGYLRSSLDDVLMNMMEDIDPAPTEREALDVLEFIQLNCEPAGVGARNLAECLRIQMRGISGLPDLVRQVIDTSLDDLMNNRLPQLAKKLGVDIETVKDIRGYLHLFNPKPGLLFGHSEATKVMPDVIVDEDENGQFVVRMENAQIPELVISKDYSQMLEKKSADAGTVGYIKGKVDSARWLIDAIQQRQNTIHRIASEIVRVQDEFLRQGVEKLKCLRMQEIADAVGVHVSTVSRAISGKFIQCPQGIFPIKYFFTGGSATEDGGSESHRAVQNKVRELVSKEDKANPLSDDEIVRLMKEQGVTLARRTVAKYRKVLDIPPARLRKSF
ncbi:MAG: RNA polymerase factor sigma-54 [Planctomycetota bacterium]